MEEYRLIFLEGNIVYAVKPHKRDVLGELLIQDRVLSEGEIKDCLMIARFNKKALGKVLVEEGLISRSTLARYIYQQLEDILFELFLWNEGEFDYTDSQFDLNWLMLVNVSTVKLIMNAARRIDEVASEQKTVA